MPKILGASNQYREREGQRGREGGMGREGEGGRGREMEGGSERDETESSVTPIDASILEKERGMRKETGRGRVRER